MSNLKKLLALESKLKELVEPTRMMNLGLHIPPETKEEALRKMIAKGSAHPDATVDDIEWLTIIGIEPPARDEEGRLETIKRAS